jgi:hypothetical protein
MECYQSQRNHTNGERARARTNLHGRQHAWVFLHHQLLQHARLPLVDGAHVFQMLSNSAEGVGEGHGVLILQAHNESTRRGSRGEGRGRGAGEGG